MTPRPLNRHWSRRFGAVALLALSIVLGAVAARLWSALRDSNDLQLETPKANRETVGGNIASTPPLRISELRDRFASLQIQADHLQELLEGMRREETELRAGIDAFQAADLPVAAILGRVKPLDTGEEARQYLAALRTQDVLLPKNSSLLHGYFSERPDELIEAIRVEVNPALRRALIYAQSTDYFPMEWWNDGRDCTLDFTTRPPSLPETFRLGLIDLLTGPRSNLDTQLTVLSAIMAPKEFNLDSLPHREKDYLLRFAKAHCASQSPALNSQCLRLLLRTGASMREISRLAEVWIGTYRLTEGFNSSEYELICRVYREGDFSTVEYATRCAAGNMDLQILWFNAILREQREFEDYEIHAMKNLIISGIDYARAGEDYAFHVRRCLLALARFADGETLGRHASASREALKEFLPEARVHKLEQACESRRYLSLSELETLLEP